jgi:large subunit ribosomal protein L11
MAKKVKAIVKLQLQAGKANPAPPVGTALGPHGVNIMEFCKEYNDRTKDQAGQVIPLEMTIFEDRTFSFVLKTPPVPDLIKQELSLEKGSERSNKKKVGKLTRQQVRKIAEIKLPDTNAYTVEQVEPMVIGTAKQMGVEVED